MAILQTTGVSGSLSISSSNIPLSTSASLFNVNGYNGRLLDVVDNLSGSLFSVNSIAGLPIFDVWSDNRIFAGKYNANDFVISGSRVGIGTNSPIGKLNVSASTTIGGANLANSHILIGTATAGLGIDTNEIYNKGGTALVIGTLDASPVQFRPNSSDAVIITATGNVGIGTSSPLTKLDVKGALFSSTYPMNIFGVDSATTFATNIGGGIGLGYLYDGTNTAIGAIIQGAKENSTSGNYSTAMRFLTRANGSDVAEAMRINSSGNVGIGTTSPSYKLEVLGDMRVSGGIVDAGSSAQWTLSGGGTVTWNGSDILWGTRVIAIPVEKGEFSSNGYIDITCPTSGNITYYNSSNVTTTVTCTANGVPIGVWEALYYEITPGQSNTSDQTKFRLVSYPNSTWRPSSNWILICIRNADTTNGHLKWIPGQINIPNAGGIYYSGTGLNNWESNGTVNYISKFTSANVLGNSTIYDNGTNVGIGTTSPSAKLHVSQGLVKVDVGPSYGVNVGDVQIRSTSTTYDDLVFYNLGSTSALDGLRFGSANTWSYDAWAGLNYFTSGTSGTIKLGGPAAFRTNVSPYTSNILLTTQGGNDFYIKSGGDVGIGTTDPNAMLHVNSSGSLAPGSTVLNVDGTQGSLFSVVDNLTSSLMSVNDISGLPILEVFSDDTVVMGTFNANTLVVTGSKVGIGLATPTATLHVNDGAIIDGMTVGSGYNNLNTIVGASALNSNTTGTYNTAVGFGSLANNSTGQRNCAFGNQSSYNNATGQGNNAFGYFALRDNTANYISAFGIYTLAYNTTGTKNSGFGAYVLRSNDVGINNSGFGYKALNVNTTGVQNNAFGAYAMQNNTTGDYNSAFGAFALKSNLTGRFNAAFGHNALGSNLTSSNSAFGVSALFSNTTGRENCVFGRAMFANTTGNFNCAFGNSTLQSNVSGAKNTTMGHSGLSSNIGNNNSAFGYKAGSTMTSGTNNSFFGYNAQPSSITVSNEITLGNSSVATLRCQVTTITALSDERDKTDINTLVNGLDIIDKVRPVTYKWDKREWYSNGVRDGSKTETSIRVGFIAQELKQMMTENGYEYLDLVYESNPDKLEATIGNLFVPLVRAVQELHEKVKILEAKIK